MWQQTQKATKDECDWIKKALALERKRVTAYAAYILNIIPDRMNPNTNNGHPTYQKALERMDVDWFVDLSKVPTGSSSIGILGKYGIYAGMKNVFNAATGLARLRGHEYPANYK